MKSFIALTLASLAFASTALSAKPIQSDDSAGLSTAFNPAIDLSTPAGNPLEELALAPADSQITVLSGEEGELTFRRLPRHEKACRANRRNAWGFGGRCYQNGDTTQSVPEPGTLALLGMGMFLLAISQRRRRVTRRAS